LHFYIRIVDTARFSAKEAPKKAVNVAANSAVVECSPNHHIHLTINVLIAVFGVGFFEAKVFLDGHHSWMFQAMRCSPLEGADI
jgi:hypothetical protein